MYVVEIVQQMSPKLTGQMLSHPLKKHPLVASWANNFCIGQFWNFCQILVLSVYFLLKQRHGPVHWLFLTEVDESDIAATQTELSHFQLLTATSWPQLTKKHHFFWTHSKETKIRKRKEVVSKEMNQILVRMARCSFNMSHHMAAAWPAAPNMRQQANAWEREKEMNQRRVEQNCSMSHLCSWLAATFLIYASTLCFWPATR